MESNAKLNMVIERFLKEGMPEHCGICLKFRQCLEQDAHRICPWLRKSKVLLRAGKATAVFFFLFALVAVAQAKPPSRPVNAVPVVVSVEPASGTVFAGRTASFTSIYSDADGWQDLGTAQILVNVSTNSRNCFSAYYDQNVNRLYLRDDANKQWLGGYAPGSPNSIENSYVTLDCSKSSVSGDGATLSVTWSVTFKPAFLGTKNIYLSVTDDKGSRQNWVNLGTCTVAQAPQDSEPPIGSIAINNGASYTNSVSLLLTLTAQDNPEGSGVSQMEFSDDGIMWTAPEPFAGTKNWTVPPGDGIKTIYVKFQDAAGNWSGAYSAAITMDTTPPQINITSPLDNAVVDGSSHV